MPAILPSPRDRRASLMNHCPFRGAVAWISPCCVHRVLLTLPGRLKQRWQGEMFELPLKVNKNLEVDDEDDSDAAMKPICQDLYNRHAAAQGLCLLGFKAERVFFLQYFKLRIRISLISCLQSVCVCSMYTAYTQRSWLPLHIQ